MINLLHYDLGEVVNVYYDQFIPLSQLLSDFNAVDQLLDQYGEVVIVKDDRPRYRITVIKSTGEVIFKGLPNSQYEEHKVPGKGVETMEILNKIGKSTFIKHYYDFKHDLIPADDLPGNFTTNSKRSRKSKARRIFREGLQLEALQIIMNSKRLDPQIVNKAKEIYEKEVSGLSGIGEQK